jgi:hypothetical protein
MLRPTVSSLVSLAFKTHLGPKTTFLLLSGSVLTIWGPSLTTEMVYCLQRLRSVVYLYYIYSFTRQHSTWLAVYSPAPCGYILRTILHELLHICCMNIQ